MKISGLQTQVKKKVTMASNAIDPGGGNAPPSYARSLKTAKFQKLNRNILEIILEKKMSQKTVNLSCEDVSRLCNIVGIRVGDDTEGYQAYYNRKGITLSIWAKQGVSLEKFVNDNPREFSSDLTISQVRPAHKREVLVLITGLSFNTPDSQVKHYIESFGAKVIGVEPVYGVFKDGPWRGQYNGERRFKADFTQQTMPMGTYHLLDGAKVRVAYPGNTRTCGRCHQPPSNCAGGGIARVCGEQGGIRTTLYEHMKRIWEKIGYDPGNEPVETEEPSEEDVIPVFENLTEEDFNIKSSEVVAESEVEKSSDDNEDEKESDADES